MLRVPKGGCVFKVTLTLNHKKLTASLSLKWTYGHLKPSRPQTMRLIWQKVYLRTREYILIYAKNEDFMLRTKVCLRPLKSSKFFFLHSAHILPCNMEVVLLMSLKLY